MFTERETKLIRLAMDSACHPGERDNCASKLIESLLKRGIDSEQFISLSGPLVYEPARAKPSAGKKGAIGAICPHCQGPDWGRYVLKFGKYRDQALRDIPLDYLQWALRELPESKPEAVKAIKRFFDQYFGEP